MVQSREIKSAKDLPMRWLILALTLSLPACDVTLSTSQTGVPDTPDTSVQPVNSDGFAAVVRAVQPVANQECRRRTQGVNCAFMVQVDTNRRSAPNAFQSVDDQGRPVLTFTTSLIESVRNPDELAFILGHEAAHHIAGHLARQERNAASGAAVFADLAALTGGSAADIESAQKLGASVGARSYSKEFELEADELGTIITYRAGYNPLVGAQFFTTFADPGDRFLGSHPPNADRVNVVRRTSARLGLVQ